MSTARDTWGRAFGERLRAQRRVAGLTQAALAERIDSDRQTIYRWERGRQIPDAHHLAMLCQALDCAAARLLAFVAPNGDSVDVEPR